MSDIKAINHILLKVLSITKIGRTLKFRSLSHKSVESFELPKKIRPITNPIQTQNNYVYDVFPIKIIDQRIK